MESHGVCPPWSPQVLAVRLFKMCWLSAKVPKDQIFICLMLLVHMLEWGWGSSWSPQSITKPKINSDKKKKFQCVLLFGGTSYGVEWRKGGIHWQCQRKTDCYKSLNNLIEFNTKALIGCLCLQVDSICLGHTLAFRNFCCSVYQIQSWLPKLGPIFDHVMNWTFELQIFRNV